MQRDVDEKASMHIVMKIILKELLLSCGCSLSWVFTNDTQFLNWFISKIFIKFQSQTKLALYAQFWPSTTLLLLLGWQTKTNSNRAHHSQCSLCQTYGEESSWPIVGKMENATCQNWNVTINAVQNVKQCFW